MNARHSTVSVRTRTGPTAAVFGVGIFVLAMGVAIAAPAAAATIYVNSNRTEDEFNDLGFNDGDTLIIQSGGYLTIRDHDGILDNMHMIVETGGTFIMENRLDLDSGGVITMNGGTVNLQDDFKFPDNDDGAVAIYLNSGTLTADNTESYRSRGSVLWVGGGSMITGNTDDERRDPSNSGDWDIRLLSGYQNLHIDDLGGNTKKIWAEAIPTGNDSTLYFGASVPSPLNDATSTTSTSVAFGEVLIGAALSDSATLSKIGDDGATYTLAIGGDATTTTGSGSISGNPGSLSIQVGIDTATVGSKTGTITVDNTSADSAGPGQGSSDGNDTINVTATVLDHASASLDATSGNNFTVITGVGGVTAGLTLSNASGTRADLDVNSLGSGVSGATGTQLVAPGATEAYTAAIATGTVGAYSNSFTVNVQDEDLPGRGSASDVSANVNGTVLNHADASFSAGGLDEVTVDLGAWAADQGVKTQGFSIWNLVTTAGYTARLDLDSGLTGSGSDSLWTNLSPFSDLAAGSSNGFTASFDTAGLTIGEYTRDYTLNLSDEDLPGADSQSLTLHLTGEIVAGGNDSTLFFGLTPNPLDDASSATDATFNFGKVLLDTVLIGQQPLNKIGTDDASYTLTQDGDVDVDTTTTPLNGTITGAGLLIEFGIDTDSSGYKTGTITVDNTSVDSLGPGQGSRDGDDTITVTADVYQPGEAIANLGVVLGDGDLATVTNIAAYNGGQRAGMFVDDAAGSVTVTGDGWSVEGLTPGVTETGVATTTGVSFSGTARFASGKLNGLYSGLLSITVEMDQSLRGLKDVQYNPTFNWQLSEIVSGVSGDQSSVFEAGTDLGNLSILRYGISDAGGGTVATLLDGTLSTESTISIGSWTAEPSGQFGGTFLSDTFTLTGIGTETIVLQATYNPSLLAGNEEMLALAGDIFLGWFDGIEWVNAVAGNTGGTPSLILGAYNSSYFSLGNYGVDTTANTVWAVINHNSEFAALSGSVVPEPATVSLLLIGAVGVIVRRRRRHR